jgi:2-C-methyl-D-erythritol 4-phosphate cytidylyltransferase
LCNRVVPNPSACLLAQAPGKVASIDQLVQSRLAAKGLPQNPPAAKRDLLRRAYAQGDLAGATDDAMLVERLGAEVIVVDGDPRNVKVTTAADLALVRAILRR